MATNYCFKNKKILITAGPTWVAIDSVRVISNIASGQTGMLLASRLQQLGANVTLILGPIGPLCCFNKKIKLIRYRLFDELKPALFSSLKNHKYDAVIHSAAVCDYKPRKSLHKKLSSGNKSMCIELAPTEKLIDRIRPILPSVYAVGFKFHPQLAKAGLIRQARNLLARAKLDLVVANTTSQGRYRAFFVSKDTVSCVLTSKPAMVSRLIDLIGEGVCRNLSCRRR